MAVIPITAVSPYILPINGGLEFTITGTFSTSVDYSVYLGINGSDADALCYSGVMGQGYVCRATLSGGIYTISAVTPILPRSTAIILTVKFGADEGNFSAGCGIPAIWAVEHSYFDQLFEARKHWLPWHDTGPRGMTLEPRQDT